MGNMFQATTHYDSRHNQCASQADTQQQPSPVLHRMPKNAQEMPPVMARDKGDTEVASTSGDGDYSNESPARVLGSTRCGKEQTGWRRQWDGC